MLTSMLKLQQNSQMSKYEPYDLVNGEIPNNTQSTYNWKEASVVPLGYTSEFLWVKVSIGKTPMF